MKIVLTKGRHSHLFNQRMEGYSEVILLKAGQKRTELMISLLKMPRPGYFQLIIPDNSKLNKTENNMR